MNKPETILTDAEMHILISGNPFTLGLSIARLKDFIRQVEKAVVAKLAEQEPVGYLHANCISFLSARGTTPEQARAKDYNTPLYTHPITTPAISNNVTKVLGWFDAHSKKINWGASFLDAEAISGLNEILVELRQSQNTKQAEASNGGLSPSTFSLRPHQQV